MATLPQEAREAIHEGGLHDVGRWRLCRIARRAKIMTPLSAHKGYQYKSKQEAMKDYANASRRHSG